LSRGLSRAAAEGARPELCRGCPRSPRPWIARRGTLPDGPCIHI
jgi:hypothetical protein